MSFFDSLKRVMGFGPDANIDGDPLFADTAGDARSVRPGRNAEPDGASYGEVGPLEFDPAIREVIFEKVVELFDEALPSFLSGAVDPAAQRRRLYDSLDEGTKKYLESLTEAAREYSDRQWKSRQTDMAAELDAIRLRAEDVERKSSDIKQKQLSADRQKRALTEKVHELESQLARLASEREQLELENRSLLNRLKVSNVLQEDVDKANAELNAVRLELCRLKENPSEAAREREESLNRCIEEMNEGLEAMKEQLRVADTMRDDLRERLRDSEKKIAERDKEIAERDKEIAELNELISQFDSATARMSEIDLKIATYQDNISAQKRIIEEKNSEIESLKASLEDLRTQSAEREKMLRKEIEELRPTLTMGGSEIDFTDREDSVLRISEEELTAMEESVEEEIKKDNAGAKTAEMPEKTEPSPAPEMRHGKGKNGNRPEQLSLF